MLEADGIVFATRRNTTIRSVGRAEERHRLAVAHDAAALRRQAGRDVRRRGSLLGTARAQYQLRQILVFLDGRPVNKPES